MADLRIIRPLSEVPARTRLVCFPHIAGGPAMFASWADALTPGTDLCLPLFPGRERSFDQRPFTDMDELCAALHDAVAPLMDLPVAFFGDCFGALVAFRLAQRMGAAGPSVVIAHGLAAPRLPAGAGLPRSDAPTGELVAYLKREGGTDPALLDDPDWMEILEPSVRGDLAVAESYRHDPTPLDIPITVLMKAADEDVTAWSGLTGADFALRVSHRDWPGVARAAEQEIARL
ncbi:thioesterase domain-containing protein [Nonomuraea sp. NBC_01738]|uniref:thioesterase II family protein n=1 Tax=Nonomuraea sp. NBC_01738 TaxID=2976003 RepID=UPI002E102B37|nr:thioesterase domain-containing protein [Nonomuraea sp. NBC_01738]